MHRRKFLVLLLTLALAFSAIPVSAGASDYADTDGHWASNEISRWSELGILAGNQGLFRPDDSITRAEMATILDRTMKYQVKAANSFTDLGQEWYTDAILRANSAATMLGSDGKVRPSDKITRQEAVVMICRSLGIAEKAGKTSFEDDGEIGNWAKAYVNAFASAGFVSGMGDNRFAPTAHVTRAAVVKMLDNAIKGLYDKAGEYSKDTAGNVVVNASGVVLKNMTIAGNLIIAEGVGEGEVKVDNVKITGDTIVRGGGKNSVYFNNVTVGGSLVVNKVGNDVRIVVAGESKASVVVLETGAILITKDVAGGGIETVEIPASLAAGEQIVLEGNFKTVENNAAGAKISATGKIDSLVLNEKTTVTGNADIKDVKVASGADSVVNGKTVGSGTPPATAPPTTGGGSGGSSGGGSTPSTVANVKDLAGLQAALENDKIKTINMTSNISAAGTPVKVTRQVTINGGGKTLSFAGLEGLDKENTEDDGLIIYAEAAGTVINGLTVDAGLEEPADWAGTYSIHVHGSAVTLNNVTATGGNAGILVNGSELTLTGTIDVSGNGFGGIEVSKGVGIEKNPSLTITDAELVNTSEAYGLPTIWEDKITGTITGAENLTTSDKIKDEQVQYYIDEDNMDLTMARVADFEALQEALKNNEIKTVKATEGITLTESIVVPKGKTLQVALGSWVSAENESVDITIKGTLENFGVISGVKDGSTIGFIRYVVDEDNAQIFGNYGTVYEAEGIPEGMTGGRFYGSILVKAENVTIDQVEVINRGDSTGSTWNRAGVYAYCDMITITNSYFMPDEHLTAGIYNGVVLLPKTENVNYMITENTFSGYNGISSGYSSAGLSISGGIQKDFLDMGGTSELAVLEPEADLDMITANEFVLCKNDYQRDSWATGNLVIYCKSTSYGSNLLLGYAAEEANYYINGAITITKPSSGIRQVKEGTLLSLIKGNITIEEEALTILKGGTLGIGKDVTLTDETNVKVENGAILIIEEGMVNFDDLEPGIYVWKDGAWEESGV